MNIPLKENERLDDLQNGYHIIQNTRDFCYGIDAVLLSDFARVKKGEQALDLGTGTGIIPILLKAKTQGEHFTGLEIQEQRAEMGQYTARHQEDLLDYIYDHFDVFRLLLDGAHGTRFSRFLDELVDIEVEYTYKYMEVIGCESVKSGLVTEEFIHIIVTAYFNGMFEVVRHNMDRAAAHRYVKMLNRYHMAGFGTVFDPQP